MHQLYIFIFIYIEDIIYFIFLLQVVFGTGDKLQAITVTSNGSFIRAAREQVKNFLLISLFFFILKGNDNKI